MVGQVNEMIEFLKETMTGMFSRHGVELSEVNNIFDEFANSRLHEIPDVPEDEAIGHFTPYYNCYMGTVSIFMSHYERWEIRELEDYVSPLRADMRFHELFNEVGKRAAILFILFLFISEYMRAPRYQESMSIVDYINGLIEGEQVC